MKFIEMKGDKPFEELKPGDLLLVQWSDFYVKHTPHCKKVMLYNIHGLRPDSKEVICKLKDNHYFNYKMYLDNLSVAECVYKVIPAESCS